MKDALFNTLLFTLTLVCCMAAQAQIYKWSDEGGNIHYSAIPPTSGNYETLPKPSQPRNDPSTTMQELRQKVETVDKARQDAEQKEKAAQTAEDDTAKRAKLCEQAKNNVQILESNKVVLQTDAQGNKTQLEAEKRQEALDKARKDVDYFCSP
jgi:hypothetical protein